MFKPSQHQRVVMTKSTHVTDEDALEMLRLHRLVATSERKSQKEIAEMYGVHPQTVSRAIKRAEKLYSEFEKGVDKGLIKRPDRNDGAKPTESNALMLPQQFVSVLSDMNQMQSVCQATGSFLATAAHTAYEGVVNETLPHEQRFQMVVTGAGAVIGTLFEIYDGMRQIDSMIKSASKPRMREADYYDDRR
jgi:predicted DNA-binding protein YlxM (UPF0122 family)